MAHHGDRRRWSRSTSPAITSSSTRAGAVDSACSRSRSAISRSRCSTMARRTSIATTWRRSATPGVRYQRNPERLGAMRNMFPAITAGRGTLHDWPFMRTTCSDRTTSPPPCDSSRSHPACGFVGRGAAANSTPSRPAERRACPRALAYVPFASGAEFLRADLRGVEPMFGSVVYRRAALAGLRVAHDEFATLVDRPFLL